MLQLQRTDDNASDGGRQHFLQELVAFAAVPQTGKDLFADANANEHHQTNARTDYADHKACADLPTLVAGVLDPLQSQLIKTEGETGN